MRRLWWFLRGVGPVQYRSICKRCGCTGQAHYGFGPGCWRFRA